ncbi:MAG TPA: 4Fe-4S dicluster domain-containing protein [Anaeromyxobacter sp.]|nr:4Fe-4S dicluster domain-containing protein [Anaeromyxobacter sp.]
MIRKIVQIDEARCDGCGLCIPSCAEGAIALVDGKARLSGDALCDGLGACLGECPQGAITVIEREAADFDEAAVKANLAKSGVPAHGGHALPSRPAPLAAVPPAQDARPRLSIVSDPSPAPGGGCPGSRPRTLTPRPSNTPRTAGAAQSRLGQWPVQLNLVPVTAPYFQGADLLVAADCVPFAYAGFHDELLAGRALVVGCPKLDDNAFYAEKLRDILTRSDIRSITVARMEVPCCGGIAMAARHAVAASGKSIPLRDVVVGVDGTLR